MNKFDFITEYKYYGRPKLNEDELDDALGLTPDASSQPEPNAPQQSTDTSTQEQPEASTEQGAQTDDTPTSPEQPVDAPEQPTENGEIEVDMTQLVLKQQETSQAVQDLLQKIDSLIKNSGSIKSEVQQQLQDFETRNKETADKLKQEIQMRTPTPLEKLQLRSMSSFPYSVKLSDYWAPAEEDKYKYSIANAKSENDLNQTNANVQKTPAEFILKQSEIMKGYDENFVKNSF